MERGAVASHFRDGRDPGDPGRPSEQPAVAAAASARGRWQRLPFRRPPVCVQGRPELENPRRLGQWAETVVPHRPSAGGAKRDMDPSCCPRLGPRSSLLLLPLLRLRPSGTRDRICAQTLEAFGTDVTGAGATGSIGGPGTALRSNALCAAHSLPASKVSRNCTSPAASNAIGTPSL